MTFSLLNLIERRSSSLLSEETLWPIYMVHSWLNDLIIQISFGDNIWPAAASIGNVIVCCCCLQLSGFDLVRQRVQAGHLYIKEKAKVKAITVLRPHIQISCVWESLTKTKNTFVLKSSCTFVSLIFQIISDKFCIKNEQLHLCQIPHSKPEIFLFL